jgi:putative transposase
MQRKRYTPEYKAKVALEAIREQKTLNELGREYGPHPVQISQWKKQALDALPAAFGDRKAWAHAAEEEELKSRLYQQIGQLQVELDWLKKRVGHLPQK